MHATSSSLRLQTISMKSSKTHRIASILVMSLGLSFGSLARAQSGQAAGVEALLPKLFGNVCSFQSRHGAVTVERVACNSHTVLRDYRALSAIGVFKPNDLRGLAAEPVTTNEYAAFAMSALEVAGDFQDPRVRKVVVVIDDSALGLNDGRYAVTRSMVRNLGWVKQPFGKLQVTMLRDGILHFSPEFSGIIVRETRQAR